MKKSRIPSFLTLALGLPRPLLALSSPGCLPSDLGGFVKTAGQLGALRVGWPCCAVVVCGCGALCWPKNRISTLASWMIVPSLLRGPRNEPLQNGVQVGLFLRADAVTRHLPVGHALQVQGVYQLVYREMATQIRFVAEDQKWNAFHGRLLQEDVELFLCDRQGFFVGRIDDETGWM